ncbi:DUF1365 domain-containing protein [Ochrobactrum sp. MYb379]|uniref:DUF1365 domain-containing protein n=1 Tax=Ochrobactrum sp. MYb379 TaxID=2745275 RepID=UPI003094A2B7
MSATLQSALVPGHVTHSRPRPKEQKLAYRFYSLLIDIDELEILDRRLRLFSVERFNLFSFFVKDRGDRSGDEIVQRCDKGFYVSPFMDINLRYTFRVSAPKGRLTIRNESYDREGLVLKAAHLAKRTELTNAALLRAFFAIPLLTLRVVGGIHWDALEIWLKGVRLRTRSHPPEDPVSHVRKSEGDSETSFRKAGLHEPS